MRNCELRKEPYEVPKIGYYLAEVEKGFVGSPDGSAGFGDYGEIGDQDAWSSDTEATSFTEKEW